jgi:hypothetical protein
MGQNLKWVLLCVAAIAAILHSAEKAHASAWALAPGEAQLIMTTAVSEASSLIGSDGNSIALSDFSKVDSRLYFEWGLFKSVMFVGQAGHQTINFQGAGSDVNFSGFDETKLGLQYEFRRREGEAASVLASYVIDGSLDDPRLNIGGRNDEVEFRALYGCSKKVEGDDPLKWVWFADVQLASRYDLKSDIVSRWQLDTTLGIKPNEKWMWLGQLYILDIKEQQIAQFTTPSVQQAKAELSFAYRIRPKRYAQLGLTQTFAGRNIVKERGLFFAIWQEF